MCRLTGVVAIVLLIQSPAHVAADSGSVSDEWVMTMVRRHCAMCHSENPSHTTLLGQPAAKRGRAEIDRGRRAASHLASWKWS